jgi:signal transduction histidine kinase
VKIIDQVDSIEAANLNARVDEGNTRDELAQLAMTFNQMLERIEKAFYVQKNFIANASHELRTPLTAVSGQIEVIQMKDRSPEEYKDLLQSVLDDIRGLNLLTNRLLMLAQASSEMTKADFFSIRIDDVLWQASAELIKRHPEYKTAVSFDDLIADEGLLVVQGNEALLKSALYNLMDNACKYSPDHMVKISLQVESGFVRMNFQDNGAGIPDEDRNSIFQPFYRGKNAMHLKGHGIGLSLVEKIIHLHGGQIQIASKEKSPTTFTVRLPLNRG